MLVQDSISAVTDTVGQSAYGADSLSLAEDTAYHGFSVWRIAQRMQGCTPQQLDSAIQANLPERERVRSDRPDTLSLPGLPGHKTYEENLGFEADFHHGFFTGNPLYQPELPSHSQGMSAITQPYTLWRDDLVTGSLLLCFILLVYAFNKIRQQLQQQTKDFFFPPREQKGLFAVETSIESRSRTFMVLQLCLLGGLMMFGYSQYELKLFLGQLSPHWLLGIYVSSFILFFIVKFLLTKFINWIFFPKFQQKVWHDSYSYLLSIESILIFPLALLFIYFRFPFEKIIWIFLFILVVIKILLAFRTYIIFFNIPVIIKIFFIKLIPFIKISIL